MKYLVVEDTGGDVFFEKFETLSEANGHAWFTHELNQQLPRYSSKRKYHIFVATPVEDCDDLDVRDDYFDSETFYIPKEERDFDALWCKVTDAINDNENLDFVLDDGKFVFSVPWDLIEDHYIEELDEFDDVGGEIIFDYYKYAVRERRDEILAFFEMD